jgi:hypothetical protein
MKVLLNKLKKQKDDFLKNLTTGRVQKKYIGMSGHEHTLTAILLSLQKNSS